MKTSYMRTATWMSMVGGTYTKKPGILRYRGSESGGYHKEFYVRATVRAARTRAAHLLLRMSPGNSRCASIASPAQRMQYTSVPSVRTELWRVVQSHYK